jgi:hypothetical protein
MERNRAATITGFEDFAHRPEFKRTNHLGNSTFLSSVEERETRSLLGPLERADLSHCFVRVPDDGESPQTQ